MRHLLLLVATAVAAAAPLAAQQPQLASDALFAEIARRTDAVNAKVVAWRRDIHEHPELSYEERRTSALVAAHLKALGLEVKENVGLPYAVTGLLRGARPGPTVALRADMDGLPVTEQVDLPFRSRVRAVYNGQDVGVMHACGHDNHVAILMGVAEVLTGLKAQLAGNVLFVFQPAEEGGRRGGAQPMLEGGAFDGPPKVDAVFGLHVGPGPVGQVSWRAGAFQASSDNFRIVVRGRQTHGAQPSGGIDPIVVGSQIVLGLQTIVSRQIDMVASPAVITVGSFQAGVRSNIIPDTAVLIGTIRALDPRVRLSVHSRLRRTAEQIAAAGGATAQVSIEYGYPVTVNHGPTVATLLPALRRAVPHDSLLVERRVPSMGAEDFSRFLEKVPGFFFGLGVTPPTQDLATAPVNHSPLFEADERALPVGVKAMASVAVEWLAQNARPVP
jgi:amidohydrolase